MPVAPPSEAARERARKRLGALTTPPGALGHGELAAWQAATQDRVPPAHLGLDPPLDLGIRPGLLTDLAP